MRRRRFRTWAKWTFTVAAVAVIAAIPLSTYWRAGVWWDLPAEPYPGGFGRASTREVDITGGRLFVLRYANQRGIDWPEVSHLGIYREARPLGWTIYDAGSLPHGNRYRFALWPAALIAAIPACVLWMRGVAAARRHRVGTCPMCKYDRAGLAPDAKCPECGTKPARG